MKRSLILGAVLGCLSLALAGEYLVRIDLEPPDRISELAARRVRVLALEGRCCLVLLDDRELSSLGQEFPVSLLDENPQSKLYFVVYPAPQVTVQLLAGLGDVLLTDDDALLLRTTGDNVLDLNRLQVELYRLPMQPMVLARPGMPAPDREPATASDSLIREIVAKVSADSVMATIRRLQNYYTRYVTTDSCRAAVDYALDRMRAYGCDSAFGHNYQTGYAPNGVGLKLGRLNPRRSYCLCGHIDNTSPEAPDHCPGADDNGSGAAVVLEACRVLAGYELDYTLRFLCFTGEEQGLVGSQAYCAQASARGDSILGAMNFDMVSYGLVNRDSMVVWKRTANPNCTTLANMYCANADTYTTLKYRIYTLSSGGNTSDHASFWQYGYQCIRDKEADVTPEYHLMGDTIGPYHFPDCGTNDVPLTVEAIKATVATFAKLAGVRRMTAVAEDRRAAAGWPLAQNAPNPFKGRTVIRYAAEPGAHTSVNVYSLAGSLVRCLEDKGEGRRRTVIWDGLDERGRRVAPGVYFYRLEGERTTAFRQAVLVQN
jgi:hypothetical protein